MRLDRRRTAARSAGDLHREVADELLELVGARDEVGLAVDLDRARRRGRRGGCSCRRGPRAPRGRPSWRRRRGRARAAARSPCRRRRRSPRGRACSPSCPAPVRSRSSLTASAVISPWVSCSCWCAAGARPGAAVGMSWSSARRRRSPARRDPRRGSPVRAAASAAAAAGALGSGAACRGRLGGRAAWAGGRARAGRSQLVVVAVRVERERPAGGELGDQVGRRGLVELRLVDRGRLRRLGLGRGARGALAARPRSRRRRPAGTAAGSRGSRRRWPG